jgi:cytochrome b
VLVILAMVGFQAYTGLYTTDDVVYSGPYNPAVSAALAAKLSSWHRQNFNFVAAVIGLHIAAILFYRYYKRQNLVAAMIHGYKPADVVPEAEALKGSQLLKALIVILLCVGAVYWLVQNAPPPPPLEY